MNINLEKRVNDKVKDIKLITEDPEGEYLEELNEHFIKMLSMKVITLKGISGELDGNDQHVALIEKEIDVLKKLIDELNELNKEEL